MTSIPSSYLSFNNKNLGDSNNHIKADIKANNPGIALQNSRALQFPEVKLSK